MLFRSRTTGAVVMESPMAAKIIKEMPIETLKEEMVAMVQEEGMSFMEAMEEPPEEEPKEIQAEPMIKTKSPQKEPKETTTKEPIKMAEEKNEEPEEKESTSENTTTSVVSSKKNIKQKKVQSKKTINAKLEKVMTKIDKEIKNSSKNLQLKNLIKMDVMIGEQLSLAVYENVEFYKPKVIYLNQLDIQDNRKIYSDITLAKYTDKDIIGIKQKELQLLDDKKQQLLNELEVLKNG